MDKLLKCKGKLVNLDGHNIHIYILGDIADPKLVLMSGSGTVAPVYDFKILYEKLSKNFRVIVIEKFGYGYSDIFDSPADIAAHTVTKEELAARKAAERERIKKHMDSVDWAAEIDAIK